MVLIIVDNGIAAVEEIAKAGRRGIKTVVLDHHIQRKDGQLPPADVIVNPHVYSCGGFEDFCGAGLAYRLALTLLEQTDPLLYELSVLAAIATVADVVPLVDDNRRIVIDGLRALNAGKAPKGLKTLIEQLNLFDVDEGDISFTIAPTLNAAGRMYDDGAMKPFKLLTHTYQLDSMAEELICINEKRKAIQVESMETAEQFILDNCMFGDPVIIVSTESSSLYQTIPQGVAGVIAGKLAEKYKVPAIVLTESEIPGELKGSGRSYGRINLKEALDTVQSLLVTYGGHPKAVGLTVTADNIELLREALNERLRGINNEDTEEDVLYDLDVDAKELASVVQKIKRYAPYGEENRQPVLHIINLPLIPRLSKYSQYMGGDHQHIKLYCGRSLSAVGFGMASRYTEIGEPIRLNIVGTVFTNKYIDPVGRASKETQIRIADLRPADNIRTASPLLASVYKHLNALGGNCGSKY